MKGIPCRYVAHIFCRATGRSNVAYFSTATQRWNLSKFFKLFIVKSEHVPRVVTADQLPAKSGSNFSKALTNRRPHEDFRISTERPLRVAINTVFLSESHFQLLWPEAVGIYFVVNSPTDLLLDPQSWSHWRMSVNKVRVLLQAATSLLIEECIEPPISIAYLCVVSSHTKKKTLHSDINYYFVHMHSMIPNWNKTAFTDYSLLSNENIKYTM